MSGSNHQIDQKFQKHKGLRLSGSRDHSYRIRKKNDTNRPTSDEAIKRTIQSCSRQIDQIDHRRSQFN